MNVRPSFRFTPITEPAAQAIVTWRYEPPFDVYNVGLADHDSAVRSLLDPTNRYVAAFNQRAIRVYERAGFQATSPLGGENPEGGTIEWLQFTRAGIEVTPLPASSPVGREE